MYIEDTIFTDALPVNSGAMLNRLTELMAKHKTNCLSDCKDDARVKAVLWLMMQQVFGQFAMIDMCKLWHDLKTELPKVKCLQT